MEKQGKFIISLDFELFWGIFDHANINKKVRYFENTLQTIPEILRLFNEYHINATWATVGFLFYNNMEELLNNLPENLPDYKSKKLSSYQYMQSGYDEKYKKYHFAPDLIKKIAKTPGQEIASHTLSHYYCLEAGQSILDFEADISTHVKIAKTYDINLKSLVFPRNQHNSDYEKVLKKHGIKKIRTNPEIWFWDSNKPETLWKKIFRTADAYLPLNNMLFNVKHHQDGIIKIPASRFFRPPHNFKILNKLRLIRIKNEMTKAAKQKKIYHLWWHPHNFGNRPKASLKELEEILEHYQKLQKKYNFISINMNSVFQ